MTAETAYDELRSLREGTAQEVCGSMPVTEAIIDYLETPLLQLRKAEGDPEYVVDLPELLMDTLRDVVRTVSSMRA